MPRRSGGLKAVGPARRADPVLDHEDGVRDAYAEHGGALYGLAVRSLGDPAAAEDAVQETFLRAWRSRETFDAARGSLRTWLFQIARNVVVDAQRARAARPWLRELADHNDLSPAAPADSTDRRGALGSQPGGAPGEVDPVLRRILVEEALRRLGEDHRVALVETYLADRPYPEVAARLGVPESTLRSRVFYGLKALRVVMEEMEVNP